MKVLIVEDSPLVRKMYGLVFSRRDHELTTAEDGRKGLEALTGEPRPFDLILLDLRMPDMDGVEFIRAVRRTGRFRDIPIVLTTVEPDGSPLLAEALALEVAAVVKKPWKPHELRAVVQTVLNDARP
ncbi:MAG TPA: response regulator [Gemmatimonadales bacterium]|nr:response regulator [Gemmatimonadales bacterium]